MTEQSKMNLLFFLGVLIPALVTVGLFAVFCYCWYKIRVRNQILYKKHDPHKIERLKESGKVYEPPPPPPPPFKSNLTLFQERLSQHNNNNIKKPENDNYEESPEPTEGLFNTMYRTNGDSGFSDLNHIQCDMSNSVAEVQRPVSDGLRPNSQASDDSDDSGFRSSRSGQYIHSASDSAGNPHDMYPHGGVSSLQVHDTVPLFKPIKIHPNELGQNPHASYIQRSSTSSKYRNNNRLRKLPPSSPGFYNMGPESQNVNKLNAIYHIDQEPLAFPPLPHRNSVPNSVRHNCNTRHISLSNYDVHGGRLHSIDSHYGPLASPGHYGIRTTIDSCGHPRSQSQYGDEVFHRADSLGYGSVCDSSLGYMPGGGQQHNRPIHSEKMYQPPQTSHFTTQNSFPISTNISGGYTISNTSHMRPIQPDLSAHKLSEPLQTVPEASIPLTVTQAMVHRPYIEELSDPSLFSVV